MKKINPISTFSLMFGILLSVGFVSCKKSTVGPSGDQGVQGVQGVTGAQGNANVKSFNFDTGCNWKADSTNFNFSYRYFVADLNMAALENGAIMLYVNDEQGSNGNKWVAMPYSTTNFNFSFKTALSTVEIFVTSNSRTMPHNPGAQKFKLVIVPPGN